MSGLFAATEPTRTIVVERGGTAWWIPFSTALLVAVVAALASYYATWRFKRSDANRENAFRAAGLMDEAEQIARREDRYDSEGGASTTLRLLQEAQVRARPIEDSDLDDRLRAAIAYNVALKSGQGRPPRARHWLSVSIWNVQRALAPHLSAPRLVPRTITSDRVFPTFDDLFPMIPMTEGPIPLEVSPDLNILDNALSEWEAKRRKKRKK
jgi:hypothetical protein